jgi:hypothetical protein
VCKNGLPAVADIGLPRGAAGAGWAAPPPKRSPVPAAAASFVRLRGGLCGHLPALGWQWIGCWNKPTDLLTRPPGGGGGGKSPLDRPERCEARSGWAGAGSAGQDTSGGSTTERTTQERRGTGDKTTKMRLETTIADNSIAQGNGGDRAA